jgi:thiol peroxidase
MAHRSAFLMTIERSGAFDLAGPKTLIGPKLEPGDAAPDFVLVNNQLAPVTMSVFRGKPMLISVVPSLDTSVCAIQTNRFDSEASTLKDKASFITVSADLPFAQARWCGANNAINGETLSDYLDMNFGTASGTYVKEVRLESRAVFVVDAEGTIRHAEYVPEAGKEPDYDAALAVLRGLV